MNNRCEEEMLTYKDFLMGYEYGLFPYIIFKNGLADGLNDYEH